MTLSRRFAVAFAVLFATSSALAAQGAAANDTSVAAVAADPTPVAAPAVEPTGSLTPLASNATAGVKSFAPSSPTPYAPKPEHVGSNVAMMIVGGAVLIIGAVVGGTAGTLIMVGGGVIGILGLYRYLQ